MPRPPRPPDHAQPGLFGEDPSPPARQPATKDRPVAPAQPSLDALDAARALPPQVYLGTSSWSFPGWRGLVYDPADTDLSTTRLARHGLAAYAASPLFRTVGIDRTFYAPIPDTDFRRYADDTPDDFRFLVKAHQALTRPGPDPRSAEPDRFLDHAYALDLVVGPALRGLGHKAGPIVFQFSPMRLRDLGGPRKLIDRLAEFLRALPPGPMYAVEVRNAELLAPPALAAYAAALASARAAHAFNVHPSMPPIAEQAELLADAGHAPAGSGPGAVVRWMLHEGETYEGAREHYAPFNRLIDEDPVNRDAIAALCTMSAAAGKPVFVIANNKAEGSAPLTLLRLAQRIAAGA